ncbi:MAG: hypothetical protein AB1445_07235 [Bacillota bacterium]
MNPEQILLGVVAACSFVTMLALVAAMAVLGRVSQSTRALQGRVEGMLMELERRAIPALGDVGGMARNISGLALAGQRLTEEILITNMARRLAGLPPRPQGPAGNLAVVRAGVAVLVHGLELAYLLVQRGQDHHPGNHES